ncbi:hypothetical protein [Burkholderia sp. 567]|uniref:hypothetical protein n=1 Tax=Burkholderia sp. 567 TaxID=3156413 RepID=UPI003392A012
MLIDGARGDGTGRHASGKPASTCAAAKSFGAILPVTALYWMRACASTTPYSSPRQSPLGVPLRDGRQQRGDEVARGHRLEPRSRARPEQRNAVPPDLRQQDREILTDARRLADARA